MFDDVTIARYARDAAETETGTGGNRPVEGYAVRAGAGRLSKDTGRRSSVQAQRLDVDAAAGRAHFASLTVERSCRCGARFRTLRFAPDGVLCIACATTKPLPRPRRVVVVDDD